MAEQGFQMLILLTECVQKLDAQKGANDDFCDCYGFAMAHTMCAPLLFYKHTYLFSDSKGLVNNNVFVE